MRILVLDNYDSFVYNLVHYLLSAGATEVEVVQNDCVGVDYIAAFDKILLSPGPGLPVEAGIMMDVIRKFSGLKPILGVCLGHQAIGEAFGGKLKNLEVPLHGVASGINVLAKDYLFEGIDKKFKGAHYHSWVIAPETISNLDILADDEHGNIMAIRHHQHDTRGVQFHPESILTENGLRLIRNWVEH